MGARVVDYRVSTVAVLCQDCGEDVLYPTRHKCQPNTNRPPVPTIPTQYTDDAFSIPRKPVSSSSPDTSSGSSSFTSSPIQSDNKLEHEQSDESIYFNKFAEHLPSAEPQQGRKLWGKVRHNEKWKQLTEKSESSQKSGKLWGKLIQATQNMADKIPSKDDKGPDSDESDWEGETHVSRILREYHEKKNKTLPNWLFDERTPKPKRYQQQSYDQPNYAMQPHQSSTSSDHLSRSTTSSRRKLWDTSNEMSSRERERNELRQQAQYEKSSSPYQQQKQQDYYQSSSQQRQQHSSNRYEDRYTNNNNDYSRGYNNNDNDYSDYKRGYNDQPVSYRSSGRMPQGEPVSDQRRYRTHDASPVRSSGYENELDDYYTSRQPNNDRLRGPRNPPPPSSSRPNRYLNNNNNHGNYI
ncbi:hypothetical protein BJ944DRAFT_198790 [Cunninghamella echinulata]|nr:hypothetical protein BJ944DRAFT_198790 [Cunninghamella echinulata]